MDAPVAPAPAAPPPATPAPVTPVPTAVEGLSRPAQYALGVFLAVTLGMLAFRGYGNGIGMRPTEVATAPTADLNLADRAELEQVPGIGPTLARAIEDHRARKGPFKSLDELRQVKGVGSATLDKIRPFLRIDSIAPSREEPASQEPLVLERKPATPVPSTPQKGSSGSKKLQPGDSPINLNAASADELMRLPGVGQVTAQHIIAARAEKPFTSVNDLTRVKGIGAKTLEKLRPFVEVK